MAESFAQRTRAVNAALRRLRAAYRIADSQGELLERELDRLILRKTIVSPESLQSAIKRFDSYKGAVRSIEGTFADTLTISGSYV